MPRKNVQQAESLFGGKANAELIVSEIKPMARDPNLCRVKAKGRTLATVRSSMLESLGLHPGARWTKPLAEKVAQVELGEKARKQLMGCLSARPCSKQQARDRLVRRGHSPEIVEMVVSEAERDGWLNDRVLAEAIVRGTTSRKPAGRRLLEARLAQRGVDADAAAEALPPAESGADLAAAWKLARRRAASMGTIRPETALRRLAALLMRRGFDETTVEATIERLQPLLNRSRNEDS